MLALVGTTIGFIGLLRGPLFTSVVLLSWASPSSECRESAVAVHAPSFVGFVRDGIADPTVPTHRSHSARTLHCVLTLLSHSSHKMHAHSTASVHSSHYGVCLCVVVYRSPSPLAARQVGWDARAPMAHTMMPALSHAVVHPPHCGVCTACGTGACRVCDGVHSSHLPEHAYNASTIARMGHDANEIGFCMSTYPANVPSLTLRPDPHDDQRLGCPLTTPWGYRVLPPWRPAPSVCSERAALCALRRSRRVGSAEPRCTRSRWTYSWHITHGSHTVHALSTPFLHCSHTAHTECPRSPLQPCTLLTVARACV
jgi:hypothetical protein